MNRKALFRLAAAAALALPLLLSWSGPAQAQPAELEGVKLEPTVQVGGTALQLNGAGVRTRAIFKVYVAGL
ncbi:MAG: chalcone isomerase family protein, partial [Betaproteobacteria bacterium]